MPGQRGFLVESDFSADMFATKRTAWDEFLKYIPKVAEGAQRVATTTPVSLLSGFETFFGLGADTASSAEKWASRTIGVGYYTAKGLTEDEKGVRELELEY